jgi:hypothetical protein
MQHNLQLVLHHHHNLPPAADHCRPLDKRRCHSPAPTPKKQNQHNIQSRKPMCLQVLCSAETWMAAADVAGVPPSAMEASGLLLASVGTFQLKGVKGKVEILQVRCAARLWAPWTQTECQPSHRAT